jgi:hypothetical protein
LTTITVITAIPGETLERRIVIATEGVRTKFIESTLRDRRRLSAENALTVSEYMILMKREINPRLTYVKYTVQFLSELSRCVGIQRLYQNMTKEDVLCYLDKCHKPENEDPLYK